MTGLAEGDTTALQALFDRHSGQVMAVCLRILRDRPRAEEATGDVFWELWKRAERYRPDRGAPLAYMMTIARSRSIDRLRSGRGREPTGAAADVAEGRGARASAAQAQDGAAAAGAAARNAGPFESAAASELRDRVQRALADLSEAERRAVEMSFFDGLSYDEIAT